MEFLPLCPIDKLIPYEKNPREITEDHIASLAAIIEANGFRDPIEVDASWEVVVGHARLLAAKKLKLTKVPVIYHGGMTRDEARAYRIASNKANDGGKWSRALLSDEILELEGVIGGPSDLGFSDAEMVKLFDLDMSEKTDEELAKMAGEEEKAEPGPYIERGQTWVMGPVTFTVFKNLNTDSLRKAEMTIIKLQRMLKEKAVLEGTEMTLQEYLAQKGEEERMRL